MIKIMCVNLNVCVSAHEEGLNYTHLSSAYTHTHTHTHTTHTQAVAFIQRNTPFPHLSFHFSSLYVDKFTHSLTHSLTTAATGRIISYRNSADNVCDDAPELTLNTKLPVSLERC